METEAPPTTRGQGDRKNEPWVEIAQDSDGWHWCLWAGNGRAIARNCEPYDSKKHAVQAVRAAAPIFSEVNLIAAVSEDE